MLTLHFTSQLDASPETVWEWISHADTLREEFQPWLHLSAPDGIESLANLDIVPDQPIFTSWMWLFGVLPIGRSKVTLKELTPGVGFVEESPMTGVRYWRHERRIHANNGGTLLDDEVTVVPYPFASLRTRLLVSLLFKHRHKVLKARCRKIPAAA